MNFSMVLTNIQQWVIQLQSEPLCRHEVVYQLDGWKFEAFTLMCSGKDNVC